MRYGVKPWAVDPDAAKLLWEWSEAAIVSAIGTRGA